MSVHEHKSKAEGRTFGIQIVVVSSSRDVSSDKSGSLISQKMTAAGHTVLGKVVAADDQGRIAQLVQTLSAHPETQVVVCTGGTGLTSSDVTYEALQGAFSREIPGFGELFRMLSYEQIGSSAMLSRACAGVVNGTAVFALPGSPQACELAVERLILPELGHLVTLLEREDGIELAAQTTDETSMVPMSEPETEESAEEDGPPPPVPSWRLGRGAVQITGEHIVAEEPAAAQEGEEVPDRGWKRAVYDLEGEIIRGNWPELPDAIERLAPVMNVLHTGGERALLKLPSGVEYVLYGWPDLIRPNSKVIAIGWGEPLAEVVALHRYPVMSGLCIDEERGLLVQRTMSVESACEAIVGRAPADVSGKLFAVQGDAVWIERQGAVYKWDGRKEVNDGSATQVLATLVLHWSNR